MERQTALVLCIIFFIIFTLLAFYGAKVKVWSSIVFGTFISLILLNLFYPISQTATDDPDFTLVLYAIFEILGVLILFIYIAQTTLNDVKN